MDKRIALLAVGTFAMGTDSFVLAGILPQIASGLGTSTAAAGQVVTAFALTYALVAPILATVTAHLPRRRLVTASLTVFVLANLAAALAPTLGLLLAARVLTAMAAAGFTPAASAAAIALAEPERRGRALAVVNGGLAVGTVFGVPAGTTLGQHLGWPASLIFIAAVALVALLALATLLPELPRPPRIGLGERLRMLTRPRIVTTIAVNAVATAGGIAVYTYLSEMVATHLALVLLAWGVGGSAGAFGAGWLADRFGAARTLTAALAALPLSLAALGFAGPLALVLPLAVVAGASGWALLTPINHTLTGLSPANPGPVIALNASGSYLGQALGAAGGGLVVSAGGDGRLLGAVAGAVVVLAFAVHLLLTRGSRSPRPGLPASPARRAAPAGRPG